MATNAPFGFRPVRYLNGSPYNGATIRAIASATTTAIGLGQPVALAADGALVAVSVTTQLIYGYAMGFEASGGGSPTGSDLSQAGTNAVFSNAKATTQGGFVHVALAPGLVCAVQMTDGIVASAALIGGNTEIANSAPNMAFGVSRAEVAADSSATLRQFNVVGIHSIPDASGTFQEVLVVANEHFFGSAGITGV